MRRSLSLPLMCRVSWLAAGVMSDAESKRRSEPEVRSRAQGALLHAASGPLDLETVDLDLPALMHEEPRALAAHQPLVDARPLRGRGVLVVDDNRASRAMLRELLEAYGMHVTEAANADAALGLVGASMPGLPQPFQLAIIDLQMPGVDGLRLAQSLRALPVAARLPLLLLTSHIAVVDETRLQQLGIRQHLDKPVRRQQLLATLCKMLGVESRLPAPPVATRDDATTGRLRGKVLVVEDNDTNQRVAVALLAELGVEAELAGNGLIALEKVREHRYDLILMDCQMPVMDGYEASAAIRAQDGDAGRVPILALTANEMQDDESRRLAAGMNGLLFKPLTLAHLGATLGRWLPAAHRG